MRWPKSVGITLSCAVGFYTLYSWFKDASNMTLEMVERLFNRGFEVIYAEDWRR